MARKVRASDPFAELTWGDLDDWAGSRIAARGKTYHQEGCVKDLAKTEAGGLVAWVTGTEQYATLVEFDNEKRLEAGCTCPYDGVCKHAVAIVLEYLQRLKNGKPVAKIRSDDERLRRLQNSDEEEWEDEADVRQAAVHEAIAAHDDPQKSDMESFLNAKSKGELVRLLLDAAGHNPKLRDEILDRHQLFRGQVKSLVAQVRRELREIIREPGWRNYWQGTGYTPDYSGVRNKLVALLESGHPDEVLALGEELMEAGIRHVEESDDEGETAEGIAACMTVVEKALQHSSLSPADRLAWVVDIQLRDDYGICDPIGEYLGRSHEKTDWSTLADRLTGKLRNLGPTKGADDFTRSYERDRMSDWIIHALRESGRTNEIIPLCEKEAEKSGSYERLVKLLIEAGRLNEAEQRIIEGLRTIGAKRQGNASILRGQLLKIRSLQKNKPAVAALKVDEFLRRPSMEAFQDCQKNTGEKGLWSRIRKGLLDFLETGTFPWEKDDWPLPATSLDQPDKPRSSDLPMFHLLIDIAIHEKQPERVLYWYDQSRKGREVWFRYNEYSIAEAVKDHSPERSIAIWKKLAEREIAQVNPSAYETAAKHLRKLSQLLTKLNRKAEWEDYLKGLRETHARKRRLMDILNKMEGLRGIV
jgi:uncharacterized Zn finger protein